MAMSLSQKHSTSSLPSPSGQKTLTPQRKHRKASRKVLKAADTSEVWPEGVEKAFADGLRKY